MQINYKAKENIAKCNDYDQSIPTVYIPFQKGTVKQNGVNGLQVEDLIRLAETRLKDLDSKNHSDWNVATLSHLENALDAQHERTNDRINRKVEGTNKP